MAKKLQKIIFKTKLFLAIPSVWLSLLILVLALASILLSQDMYARGKSFESSMFSNIFAGLITGFIITILSGIKNVYITLLQGKVTWLKQLQEMILKHLNKQHELYKASSMSDEEFFNTAYDTASYANHVNLRIIQSTFDKVKWFDPPKYCLKHYNYDCMDKIVFFESLRDYLYINAEFSENRKEVINRIDEARHIMFGLNLDILNDITSLEVKIANAQKSII